MAHKPEVAESFDLFIGKKRQLTLPPEVLEYYKVPISSFKASVSKEGILLKPQVSVDASQAWFWTRRWQEGERKSQKEIDEGKTVGFKNAEDLIKDLDK